MKVEVLSFTLIFFSKELMHGYRLKIANKKIKIKIQSFNRNNDFKKILSEKYENNRSKIVCCFVMATRASEQLTVENDLINTPSSAMINRRRHDFQLSIFTANVETNRFLYLHNFGMKR